MTLISHVPIGQLHFLNAYICKIAFSPHSVFGSPGHPNHPSVRRVQGTDPTPTWEDSGFRSLFNHYEIMVDQTPFPPTSNPLLSSSSSSILGLVVVLFPPFSPSPDSLLSCCDGPVFWMEKKEKENEDRVRGEGREGKKVLRPRQSSKQQSLRESCEWKRRPLCFCVVEASGFAGWHGQWYKGCIWRKNKPRCVELFS